MSYVPSDTAVQEDTYSGDPFLTVPHTFLNVIMEQLKDVVL
eukprot:CAMPEP_0113321616 /NCGR_PEP_ID=MMETSP0010_2-20120614/15038_1 /TAXON_ID=216773 ORGANISM="Corethron hystrix, Strain 308" /NCGR_SAMPLE_ID=MMETSP0010_2 /ASSEMBLY_ACC=CAM_ASM_000155 /LENGTH=40 /DNA_ID=CAMNT_0000179803 /DNA_START=38 /DNA_END=160 /DNA_ORIENTATION=+ /assembly_acc=CAM_ASM_000155